MKFISTVILSLFLFISCNQSVEKTKKAEAVSLLGKELFSSEPSEELLEKYNFHKSNYEADPSNPDLLIWYARFMAYKGNYNEAIEIYTKGVKQFPNDARFLRHRAHRYITIRKFDEAIADLEIAAKMIEETENEIEPDGMPNARNIPVSTLHGNIWYHLGLAYYQKDDMPNALEAYKNCLASVNNNDNIVSSTNWIYMILRRMGQKEEADKYLDAITSDMDVIENMDYHKLCLLYKEEMSVEDIFPEGEITSGSDAIKYGIGNWYFYNGEEEKAKKIFEGIINSKGWASFGHLSAEAHYAHYFVK